MKQTLFDPFPHNPGRQFLKTWVVEGNSRGWFPIVLLKNQLFFLGFPRKSIPVKNGEGHLLRVTLYMFPGHPVMRSGRSRSILRLQKWQVQ